MYSVFKICARSRFYHLFPKKISCDVLLSSTRIFCKASLLSQLERDANKYLSKILRPLGYLKFYVPTLFIVGAGYTKTVLCQQKFNAKKVNNFLKSHKSKTNSDDLPFLWKELFKLLVPHLWWLIAVVIATVAVAFINIKLPLVLGELVNVLVKFTGGSTSNQDFFKEIFGPAKKLLLMYSAQGLLTSIYISLLFTLGENLAADMKAKLFRSIILQDVVFFDRNRAGDLVHRLSVDIQEFKSSFKMCISHGLKNVIQTSGCIVSMMILSPKLTISLVGLISFIIVAGSLLGTGLRVLSRNAQGQLSKTTMLAEEAVGNLRTVRAFAMENLESEQFQEETNKSSHMNIILGYGIALFQGLSNIALNGLVLSTLCIGGLLMSKDEVTAGSLMSFLVATQAIQKSLDKLSVLYGVSIQGMSAGARIFEFMLLEPGVSFKGSKIIPYHSLHCDINFNNVSFSYPTRESDIVLKNFSLDIKGGKKVALVGPSGGGKSTVVALLERFYEVESGSITLDGIDIKQLDPFWLRGRVIGFIGQEPVLFATSIKENIRYGKPTASDEEVIEAAKQANAHDFITSFPDGYDTVLGERGVSVSGGQKQRIAIARALIKNPPILILDEATSALDVESERIVQEAIDKVSKGRTLLIVAHRLSTIKNVDLVAVVVDGRIVEVGKLDDLKKRKGAFWDLIKNQH